MCFKIGPTSTNHESGVQTLVVSFKISPSSNWVPSSPLPQILYMAWNNVNLPNVPPWEKKTPTVKTDERHGAPRLSKKSRRYRTKTVAVLCHTYCTINKNQSSWKDTPKNGSWFQDTFKKRQDTPRFFFLHRKVHNLQVKICKIQFSSFKLETIRTASSLQPSTESICTFTMPCPIHRRILLAKHPVFQPMLEFVIRCQGYILSHHLSKTINNPWEFHHNDLIWGFFFLDRISGTFCCHQNSKTVIFDAQVIFIPHSFDALNLNPPKALK